MTFETTIEIDGKNISVTVEGESTSPGSPGVWYQRNGDPGNPPEAPEVEINRVISENGDIEFNSLTEEDQNRLYEEAVEELDEADNFPFSDCPDHEPNGEF